MNISIIILHYKNTEKTAKCLDSVLSSDLADLSYEIIVVDNGSGDNIEEVLKGDYSDIKLVVSSRNLGMGPGNNLGIKEARGEFLLLLNDDIVLERDSIMKLLSSIRKDKDIAVAAPRLVYPDGAFQPSCFRFPNIFTPFLRRTFLGKFFKKHLQEYAAGDGDSIAERECDWIMGSCWLVRKTVVDKIGAFDERFFYYLEDTDFCRRAGRAGYKILYCPNVVVRHEHGRRSAKRPWYIAPFTEVTARHHIRSFFKYFWKWLWYNANRANKC